MESKKRYSIRLNYCVLLAGLEQLKNIIKQGNNEVNIMYEDFEQILKAKGVKITDVIRETGLSDTFFSNWKEGIISPSDDKYKKMADYFGVSVEHLMSKEERILSDENIWLDVRVTLDFELKEVIKKYYSLDEKDQKLVIDFINLLIKKKEA